MNISKFIVNNVEDPEPVIATSYCRHIIIGEDAAVPGWPTSDYEIQINKPGAEFIRRPAAWR